MARSKTTGATGSFVRIRGATIQMTIPAWQQGLIVARFSANDWCSGGSLYAHS